MEIRWGAGSGFWHFHWNLAGCIWKQGLQWKPLKWSSVYTNVTKEDLCLEMWRWWPNDLRTPSCVWFFATPWTVTHQAPLSMGFSRQEYWSGLPCPPPDLPDPGTKPRSPVLRVDSLPLSHQGSLAMWYHFQRRSLFTQWLRIILSCFSCGREPPTCEMTGSEVRTTYVTRSRVWLKAAWNEAWPPDPTHEGCAQRGSCNMETWPPMVASAGLHEGDPLHSFPFSPLGILDLRN